MALKQFTIGEKLLASDLNSMVDAIQITEITWSNLKTLRDTSQLIPGATYRITDYTCTTTQKDTQSAGHVFDILVTADDVNVLNENAHAIQHSGDTYFENSDLSAWELKYCLDNDTTRFAWADNSSNGRGVVYYMKDDLFNECPYDFKNIQFKLVKLSSITWNDNVSSGLQSSYNNQFVGHYVGDWFTVNEAGTANTNTGDTTYTYTFSGALDVDGTVEGTIGRFGNNTIEPYYNDSDNGDGTYAMLLNHIVIIDDDGNDTDNMTSNKFGGNCHHIFVYGYSFNNNTFGNECGRNTFGNNCYDNTLGNSFQYNTFGNSCNYNTFGNSCYSNTFGNECNNNTFGNGCNSNTFGNICHNNTFGNSCYSNIFGNNFSYNTLKNKCYSNTFGNDNIRNTVGNECDSNTFGDACSNNMFGNNCFNNAFGNNCHNNTIGNLFVGNRLLSFCIFNAFGNNVKNNQFGEFFTSNTFGNNFQYNVFATSFFKACTFFDNIQFIFVSTTASNGWELQNMQVLNGTQGTNYSNRLQIVGNLIQAGRAYTTTIGKNSSGTLTSKVLMDA